jgi:hypothetical protein
MPRVEADLVAAEITPRGGKEREVARALRAMGFRVHAVGVTISVDAPRERWKAVFAARFAPLHRRREKLRTPGAAASTQHMSHVAFQVPAALEPLVESVAFVEPPELFWKADERLAFEFVEILPMERTAEEIAPFTPTEARSSFQQIDGRSVFRFDTFGDEQLWTDTLRMQGR